MLGFTFGNNARVHAILPYVLGHVSPSCLQPCNLPQLRPFTADHGRLRSNTRGKVAYAHGIECSTWSWVLENKGRFLDLPEEDGFSGFEGFEELLPDYAEHEQLRDVQSGAGSYSKVSRQVRKAFRSSVSIDTASAANLVALSESGAAVTGIPRDTARALRRRQAGPSTASQNNKGSTLPEDDLRTLALMLTGSNLVHGTQPWASCYGGHQFGTWAGQLGDGRVATLGDIRVQACPEDCAAVARLWHGELIEVQLKGIGKTPFSRGGDGKAELRSCLREYLFSEALAGLGLSTAIVVSVASTGEPLQMGELRSEHIGRPGHKLGAILCRVAPSFLRFGSFELPARRGEMDLVRQLADFCIRYLRPHLGLSPYISSNSSSMYLSQGQSNQGEEQSRMPAKSCSPAVEASEPSLVGVDHEIGTVETAAPELSEGGREGADEYLQLLISIVEATAKMVAGWHALGFCHGVLNTDNFSVLGLGLDLSSCSFMSIYMPSWSPNESDSALRYAFRNQPDVAAWNCERLAEAFSSLIGVIRASEAFFPAFDAAFTSHVQRKLGLACMNLGAGWVQALQHDQSSVIEGSRQVSSDAVFVLEFLHLMADCRVDFSDTWRALMEVPALSVALRLPSPLSYGASPETSPQHVESIGPGYQVKKEYLVNILGAGIEVEENAYHRIFGGPTTESDTQIRDITDEECLRPLSAVLRASNSTIEQVKGWSRWIRRYMARIDLQGIGKDHPGGREAGLERRLDVMRRSSPAFVLREPALNEALAAAEQGDMSCFHELERRLSDPYT